MSGGLLIVSDLGVAQLPEPLMRGHQALDIAAAVAARPLDRLAGRKRKPLTAE
jgi:hypothetical protein